MPGGGDALIFRPPTQCLFFSHGPHPQCFFLNKLWNPIYYVFYLWIPHTPCFFVFFWLPTNVCRRWRRKVLDQNHLSCYPMFALYIKDVKIQVFFDNWKLSTHSLGDFYRRQIQLHVLHLINTCRSILRGATLWQDVGCDWLQPPVGERSL